MNIIQTNKLNKNDFLQLYEIDKTFYISIINKEQEAIKYFKKTNNYKYAFSWYNFLYYSKLKI